MVITRYHLTLINQIDHYGDATVISGTILSDVLFRALVDFDNADTEFIEGCMEIDENIVAYRAEVLPAPCRLGQWEGTLATAANYMDNEIREELHSSILPCDDQGFLDAYAKRHEDKFNKPFIIN